MENNNQNGYTYVDGMGFSKNEPRVTEEKMLKHYSGGISIALILFSVFSYIIPFIFSKMIQILVPVIRFFSGNYFDPDIFLSIASVISYVLVVALPFLLYALAYHIPPRIAIPFSKINKSDTVLMVLMSLGVSAFGAFASAILSSFLKVFGIITIAPNISFDSGIETVAFVLESCVLAPIIEEIAIRGVVMQSLRRFGDRFALLCSSVIFAAIHLNLTQAPTALVMGLVIGYFVLRTNSLKTGIIIHAVNNALAVLVSLVSELLTIQNAEIFTSFVFIVYLVCGIVALLVISRKYKNIFYLNETSGELKNRERIGYFVCNIPMWLAFCFIATATLRSIIFT